MRVLVVVAMMGCATAEPLPVPRADIARVLYLDDCKPNGCVVFPGTDDARVNHSSIVERQIYLDPFSHDDAVWTELVACMRRMYEPFELEVTTTDPGDAPHIELMIAGYPQAVGLIHAGGAAVTPCPQNVRDNALGFVFAKALEPDVMCWSAAQESGHMFGLDHSLHPLDPMTWLAPPVIKPAFQDANAACGETEARPCACNVLHQNTYEVLLAVLGPRQVLRR